MLKLILLSIVLYTFFLLECQTQILLLPQQQQSKKRHLVYLTKAKKKGPLLLLLDGSDPHSAWQNHSFVARQLQDLNLHILTIEKPGKTKDTFDKGLYLRNDFLEGRLLHHLSLLASLSDTQIPHWNRKIILLGMSEGGKLAAKLGVHLQGSLLATIIIGAGGGLSFEEEISYQLQRQGEYSEKEIQYLLHTIKYCNPSTSLMFGNKSSVWWTQHLCYHPLKDLIKIKTPILLMHGIQDPFIPIESADFIYDVFNREKKENLTYYRLKNTGHICTRYMLALCHEWIETLLKSNAL